MPTAIASASLPGRTKAGVFLLSLDAEVAATVLRQLAEREVDAVAQAVASLEAEPPTAEQIEAVLREAHATLTAKVLPLPRTRRALEELLHTSLGQESGEAALSRLEQAKHMADPFAGLDAATPDALVEAIRTEHPQVAALVLSEIDPTVAASILDRLPQEAKVDVIRRMAKQEGVPPDVLADIGGILREKIDRLPKAAPAAPGANAEKARLQAIAEILRQTRPAEDEEPIVDVLTEEEPELGEALSKLLLSFDDLGDLDDRSIRKVLSQIEGKTLAMSLKAASDKTREKILGNLSKRARLMLEEERDALGPQPLSAVEDSQQEVIDIVRGMEERGDIHFSRGGDAQLVE